MVTEQTEDGRERYVTAGGIAITRSRQAVAYEGAIEPYFDWLDTRRGAVLFSNYEYPGRYTRQDVAFVDPPLVISSARRDMRIEALNPRGRVLLGFIDAALAGNGDIANRTRSDDIIDLTIVQPTAAVTEEERSRMPSVFSVLRTIVSLFRSEEGRELGLYGAFGYDLAYQFEPVPEVLERDAERRDLVLYLPDELLEVDHYSASAFRTRYDFAMDGASTEGLEGGGPDAPFAPSDRIPPRGDHKPGEYADLVRSAKEKFMRGDLFEVVPGQVFYERAEHRPSEISRRLKAVNPSPYSFFVNLGSNEFLIGASPEMFVRVNGRR
ncbi:MAG: chorismate-binding protein, partial [Aurantimonas coralicida]|nr:chorismate-binding protein [Aurantimonas coralicida]